MIFIDEQGEPVRTSISCLMFFLLLLLLLRFDQIQFNVGQFCNYHFIIIKMVRYIENQIIDMIVVVVVVINCAFDFASRV